MNHHKLEAMAGTDSQSSEGTSPADAVTSWPSEPRDSSLLVRPLSLSTLYSSPGKRTIIYKCVFQLGAGMISARSYHVGPDSSPAESASNGLAVT